MANTQVTLTNDDGVLVPSQASVHVTSGDTVAFSIADGSSAYLFFSPAAASALSPAPSSPVEISASATEYTFVTSDSGAYSVFFETSEEAAVPPFPVAPSNLLMLEIDAVGLAFGGQDNNTRR